MRNSERSLVALACCIALTPCAAAQPFSINWYTIDCGGGESSAGPFTLNGTIGQHDTGVSAAGPFVLSGGYWAGGAIGGCAADIDGDGDADADDFFSYLDAFAVGNTGICDIDGDGDCDADDFFGYLDRFAMGC